MPSERLLPQTAQHSYVQTLHSHTLECPVPSQAVAVPVALGCAISCPSQPISEISLLKANVGERMAISSDSIAQH